MKQTQIKIMYFRNVHIKDREDIEQDREENNKFSVFSVPFSLVSVFYNFISYILDLVFAPYKAQAKRKCKLIRLNTDFSFKLCNSKFCQDFPLVATVKYMH